MCDRHGILPVYKEAGWTSNDVVSKLRGILHMKKIGHTGTLDPMVTGVLPVCLGRGTKLVGMLTDTDKTYRCVLRLGVETDTEDLTGNVIRRGSTEGLTEEMIREAMLSFRGEYMQTPPMYSAKKINGRRLYELARSGETVERKPVKVLIKRLDIEKIDPAEGTAAFTVECSKGTYIRTLCRDIGEKLGCGGTMESLIRTEASGFSIGQALTLAEIEALSKAGRIGDRIIPVDRVFASLKAVTVDPADEKKVVNGNMLRMDAADGRYRVYLPDGRFAAVYEVKRGRAEICGFFLT